MHMHIHCKSALLSIAQPVRLQHISFSIGEMFAQCAHAQANSSINSAFKFNGYAQVNSFAIFRQSFIMLPGRWTKWFVDVPISFCVLWICDDCALFCCIGRLLLIDIIRLYWPTTLLHCIHRLQLLSRLKIAFTSTTLTENHNRNRQLFQHFLHESTDYHGIPKLFLRFQRRDDGFHLQNWSFKKKKIHRIIAFRKAHSNNFTNAMHVTSPLFYQTNLHSISKWAALIVQLLIMSAHQ